MAQHKLSKIQLMYIDDYCIDANGNELKYGNATLAVGLGKDCLEVRIQNATHKDVDSFLEKYLLPEIYNGLKVNYRLSGKIKARK